MLQQKTNTYYLVVLLEGELLKKAAELQNLLATRYNLYKGPYPPLHVTVGVIAPENETELAKTTSLLKPCMEKHLPFIIRSTGIGCFDSPYKSVNMLINKNESISALSAEVYKTMVSNSIDARSFENWDYHVSLANTFYASREWSYKEFQEAASLLAGEKFDLKCTVSTAQLWDPNFPPLRVLAAYRAS